MTAQTQQSQTLTDDWLSSLRQKKLVERINRWMTTPGYILLIAALTAIAYTCSAELAVYSVFVVIGLYISFLGDDYLPLTPIVFSCYIAPSAANNPGMAETSIFYPAHGGIYILCLAAVFFSSVVVRLCCDRTLGRGNFLKAERKLLPGILALGVSYLLAGAFSGHYFDEGIRNPLFGLIQFVSVAFMYWFFTGAVRWERVKGNYFIWVGFAWGLILLTEILHIYLVGDLVRNDGVIEIGKIRTGWGNANNVGAMIAMMIPFAFYLASHEKHGWIYNFCASALLVGVVLTSSRTAILGAGLGYGCGFLLSVHKSRLERNRSNLIAHILTVVAALAVVVVFWDTLMRLFTIMIDKGFDSSRRDTTYLAGLKQWLDYPIFGGTFYPIDFSPEAWSKVEAFTSFYPPRWHNTLVQMAACCGTVGLLAYSYHRIQTLRLFLRKKKQSYAVCIGLSLLGLLTMSLLDCHFFNVGPTLFYSMALAFLERTPEELNL